MNPKKLEPFSKAYTMQQQERSNNMWMMGHYVAAALNASVCNMMPFVKRRQKGKYPDKPFRLYPMTEEEKLQEQEKALQQFLGFTCGFEKEEKRKTEKGE